MSFSYYDNATEVDPEDPTKYILRIDAALEHVRQLYAEIEALKGPYAPFGKQDLEAEIKREMGYVNRQFGTLGRQVYHKIKKAGANGNS